MSNSINVGTIGHVDNVSKIVAALSRVFEIQTLGRDEPCQPECFIDYGRKQSRVAPPTSQAKRRRLARRRLG